MEKNHKIVIKSHFLKLMQTGEWKSFVDSVIQEGCNIVNTKKINGYTLLSCATEYGDKEIVEYLMQNGAKSNVTNFDGSIPLHVAAKHNHKDLSEFFINSSVCVDTRDYMNRTPLHYVTDQLYADTKNPPLFISGYDKDYYPAIMNEPCSFEEEHMELVSFLLSHGADIDATDSDGNVPLFFAVMHSCTGVVEMLIRRGASVNKFRDDDRWTVLHYASYFGWLNVVQCIVEGRVDLNAETMRGDTPLLLAAKNSHEEVVELLVKSGAHVNNRSMLKMTALHYASQGGWLNVVKLLVEYKADIKAQSCSGATPVMLAVKHMRRDIFNFLVKCGADLVGCEGKTTILHYACKTYWDDVVQALVDGGSDIDAQTREGDTPLLIAARCSRKKILYILIKSGASLHICNPNSYSLLYIAIVKDWIDIVQRIIDAGLDINTKNPGGRTPLMLTVMTGNLRIFNCLLEAGAYINDKACRSNTTCLHLAVNRGNTELVKHLLDAGADVNVKRSEGKTPLFIAVSREYMGIAKHLLNAGANCNEDNGNGSAFQLYAEMVDEDDDLEELPAFIENGAYITNEIYGTLMNNSFFEEEILKNAEVCTQAIVNKFNNLDLHKIYQVPFAVKNLPPIEGMKIGGHRYVAQCIEDSVIRDIDTNGYCNITAIQPVVLSLLCAKAFIKHYIEEEDIEDKN